MEQNYLSRAAKYLADLRKRKAWRKVVSGMGAVVVFCTVYALILPALTWARPVTCGQEEHVHDESCYASLPQESAGPAQMAAQTPAEPQCSVESIYEVAAPGQEHADFVLHTHGDECFLDGGIVICTLPTGFPLHVHDESCYTEQPVLVCGQEGAPEGSVPSPDPVVPAPEPVIHHHSDTCYTKTLICGQEEVPASEGHRHSDACYEITTETIPGELICGITDDPAHIHGEECYAAPQTVEQRKLICLLPESDPIPGHQHMDACWEQTLTCGKEEGQPEPIVDIMDEPVPAALGQETAAGGDASVPPAPAVHVHSESCYQMQKVLTCDKEQYTEHLHVPECYDENGGLTCGRLVTVSHVHTAECFPQPEQPGPVQPEEPERVLACGKEEHTHTDLCYAPEEPALPDNTQQKEQWDAIFWSNYVDGASDVVLDAQVSGTWSDTAAMDTERLTQLYAAPAEDLSRYLSQEIGIQVDAQLYHSELHGPMDADAGFSILLKWSHDEASFSTMTYTYQFPEQVVVADVERRILSDAAGPALAYSVAGNLLTVTYYAPAAAVEASFLLKAAWAPELGESAHIQWTPSTFTDVTFAKPELTVAKTMGEDGLRVMEDGTVWADYTVTVTNSGKVQAKEITFTDTLESQYFHFARGAFENGADYSLTVNTSAPEALSTEDETPAAPGAEQFLTFENYDGGNVLTFPAFDLAAGESRVFQYKASMSSEDRERVDEAIAAAKENAAVDAFAMPMSAEQPAAAGETVRNTATVTCPACGEGVEYSASSQGTYNGLESKHINSETFSYSGETFDVVFTVDGDAILPPGISAARAEELGRGAFLFQVTELDESTEEYRAFAEKISAKTEGEESADDSSEQLELAVLGLELRYNSMKLDLSDCEVMATITPNQAALLDKAEPPKTTTEDGEEAGFSIEMKAFTLEEQTDAMAGVTTEEAVEQGRIEIDVSADTNETTGITAPAAPVAVTYADTLEDGADPLTLVLPQMMRAAASPASSVVNDSAASADAVDSTSMTVAFKNGRGAVLSQINPYPEYTVQFYANLDRLDWVDAPKDLATSSEGKVPIIDTSGKDMPRNTTPMGNAKITAPTNNPLRFLELTAVTQGYTATFKTKQELTRIFTERTRQYNPKVSLNLQMLDNLTYDVMSETPDAPLTDLHYKFEQLWVLKAGGNPENESDWEKYERAKFEVPEEAEEVAEPSVKFTNSATEKASAPDKYILVSNGAVFRMVYKPETGSHTNAVNFYDYDISSGGERLNSYNNGNGAGINSSTNYNGTGAKLAFGNNNMGAPFGDESWTGHGGIENKLNMFNRHSKNWTKATFHGNTFGLVTGLDLSSGHIQYAAGVNAPDLFNEGPETGKTCYDEGEYQLGFVRSGDTYTLSDVTNASRYNPDDSMRPLSNLNELVIVKENQYSTGVPVPSNSFWPMDNALSAGTQGHDILFGKADTTIPIVANGTTPPGTAAGKDASITLDSDDKAKHNSYFGMQFAFEFELPEGYVGPLDYVFFGDDDLWMFLDGQLVCDLGGVKSSTCGEYVNLADYIEKVPDDAKEYAGAYKAGKHTLQLFYLERGATGSTCWMQFTIPNIRSVPIDPTPDSEKGSLRIYKEVSGAVDKNQAYEFNLTIEDVSDVFSVKKYDKDLNPIDVDPTSTGVYDFVLKDGESLAVYDLPKGKHFTITEIGDNLNSYTTTITSTDRENIVEGKTIEGVSKEETTISVTYTNTFHYTLPETGGPGTTWYTYGVLPALVAAVVLYKRSRKKGGTVS